jgi:copper chaperone CopZ
MVRRLVFGLALCFASGGMAARAADAHVPAAGGDARKLDDAAVAAAVKALKVGPQETIIFVEDLHCATCAKKVTSRLFKMKGVKRVRTSVKFDAAVVTPQARKDLDAEAAWMALHDAGYQPTRLIGPAGVFGPDDKTKGPLKIAEAQHAARN